MKLLTRWQKQLKTMKFESKKLVIDVDTPVSCGGFLVLPIKFTEQGIHVAMVIIH